MAKIPKSLIGKIDYFIKSLNDNKFFVGVLV